MQIIKKITICVFLTLSIIFILSSFNNVLAATVSLNVPSSVTEGDTINATITGAAEQWNLKLQVNGSNIAQTHNLTNEGSEIAISASGTYNTTTSGSVTFVLVGDYSYTTNDEVKVENVSISKTVTVNAKVEDTPSQNQGSAPSTDNDSNSGTSDPILQPDTDVGTTIPDTSTPPKSNDATLANLGIKEDDFSGFKKYQYEYSHEVENELDKVTIYAQLPKDSKATIISGTGIIKLSVGLNTINVVVRAEDGTEKTYTINDNIWDTIHFQKNL